MAQQPPLSVEDVARVAAEEGLQLLEEPRNPSGFRCVMLHQNPGGCMSRPYFAKCRSQSAVTSENPHGNLYLGSFATAQEAALAYARHLGRSWFEEEAERAAERAAATAAAAEATMERQRKKQQRAQEVETERQAKKSARKAPKSREEVAQAKERAKAERAAMQAAMQAELHERQRQQAEQQKRLLQEAALAQRARQSSGGGSDAGVPRPAGAAAACHVAAAPSFVADGPVEDFVAMVLAGADPTLEPTSCLGLQPDAGREQCRKRYLHLVLRLHPDKSEHPQAHAAFKRVEQAWRIVENAHEKHEQDQERGGTAH